MRIFVYFFSVWTLFFVESAQGGEICEVQLQATQASLDYFKGEPVQISRFPAPRFSTFFLGAGNTGRIYRVIDNKTKQSFETKRFVDPAYLKNDLQVYDFLRSLNPARFGIRVIQTLEVVKDNEALFEDVKGVPFLEVINAGLLPEEQIDELLQNLYLFELDVLKVLKAQWLGKGSIYFHGRPTKKFPQGPPHLKGHYGVFIKSILIKMSNILYDVEKAQLVIVDPN